MVKGFALHFIHFVDSCKFFTASTTFLVLYEMIWPLLVNIIKEILNFSELGWSPFGRFTKEYGLKYRVFLVIVVKFFYLAN